MIQTCTNLYLRSFDEDLRNESDVSERDKILDFLMEKPVMKKLIRENYSDQDAPLFITDSKGLVWVVIVDEKIHILGPSIVRGDIISSGVHALFAEQKTDLDAGAVNLLVENLPGISVIKMMEYAVMFYYAVKEKAITVSKLVYLFCGR